MSTWRNLLTPNVSRYLDSQLHEASFTNTQLGTPLNNDSTFSKGASELSSKRLKTSEFGEAETKQLKYKAKLDQIQREILVLKKQNDTFSKENTNSAVFSSYKGKHDPFLNSYESEKKEIGDKIDRNFIRKTKGYINELISDDFGAQTNKRSIKKDGSFYERKRLTTDRKKTPSCLSIKDFNMSTDEPMGKKEENQSNSKQIRTKSLDNLENELNLTNLVRSLQEKLKNEMCLRIEIGNKLKKSEKEIKRLKDYISKLEKEFKETQKKLISSPRNELSQIYESKLKNEKKIQQELSATKSHLLGSIEQILQMFTSEKEKEDNLSAFQTVFEEKLAKFNNIKAKFTSKKLSISKISRNYDLPLQSNENSKISSLKDDSKLKVSPSERKETDKIENSNNFLYTPSNFEKSLSFYENLKTSIAPN